jgi:phage terminase large subunit GpA-like protein
MSQINDDLLELFKLNIKNTILSPDELTTVKLPIKQTALDIVKKIRLPLDKNILGKIDIDLTPYLILPISLIGKNQFEWVIVLGPTQSGKTVFTQVAIADSIDQSPGTMFYVFPDEKSGKRAVEEKIIGMIRSTPEFYAHVVSDRDLNSTSVTMDHMTIYPAWSNSPASMNSIPAQRAVLDEVRLMKLTVGDESNAIKLTTDRLTTYLDAGQGQGYMASSPSIEGDLLHQQLSIPGTLVLYWHVLCTHCNKYNRLDFFKDFRKETMTCHCRHCGKEFSDKNKKKDLNKNGKYLPLDGGDYDLSEYTRIVCWYDSMVSPFRSFKKIWNEYIQTKDKMHDYRNFIQCWLARFWIDDISKTQQSTLTDKMDETLYKGIVPVGVKCLTAGFDTQGDGFYVVIRGWVTFRHSYLIDQFFIPSKKTTTITKDSVNMFKAKIEDRIFPGQDGRKWKVAFYAGDSGGNRTKEVYAIARELGRIHLAKGRNTQNKTLIYSNEAHIWLVRTDEYLEETEDAACLDTFILPKNTEMDYVNQFLNIRKTPKLNRLTGETKIVWRKIGQNDYRMAEVHAYMCLDLPHADGTLRSMLEDPEFMLDMHTLEFAKAEEAQELSSDDSVDADSYDVGSFTDGW